MNLIFSSAEVLLPGESVLSLRPLHVAQLIQGWAVDVTAADRARLATPADAPRG
ncbi:hypothetical protein ACH5A3_32890 [Streptomyces echinatus]|uniref:hypothetical protein n=1 Tax=Streptomyces echinatus TaxID=67293 RepID=UPI0037AF7448